MARKTLFPSAVYDREECSRCVSDLFGNLAFCRPACRPGVLTILLGLIMVDIPGKRPLEARIIQRPSVLAAINKLRAKYDKPPLVLD